MSPRKARLVTACQQLLVLGTVLAVLTPAAGILSLDVVDRVPGSPHRHGADASAPQVLPPVPEDPGAAGDASPARPAPATRQVTSEVPTEPVQPEVTEVALTSEQGAVVSEEEPAGNGRAAAPDEVPGTEEPVEPAAPQGRMVSAPQPVGTFGTVGVTWSSQEELAESDLTLSVRTQTDGTWGEWTPLEYHAEHAPDPESGEATTSRPGTEPLVVGEVDAVQVSASARDGSLPRDLSLAVVEPGRADDTTTESPQIAVEQDGEAVTRDRAAVAAAPAHAGTAGDGIVLQADIEAAKPRIYSRAQWGADESMRNGFAGYGDVSGGFVHHTVNGNDYSRSQVPGLMRSIYAYHTQSRGWSDIGYNFLVDKFGRIWEGRWGGVAKPVIGAHTYGYNSDSFAMSAIGNFENVEPPRVMLEAYGDLFAWKLSLHDVRADDMSQNISGGNLDAINGHRDAGQTACPGIHLYREIDTIRRLAQAAQDAGSEPAAPKVTPRQPDSDLTGDRYADLALRRASDGRGIVLPTGGLTAFRKPRVLDPGDWAGRTAVTSPDLDGDDLVDLLVLDETGALEIRPGLPDGGFGEVWRRVRSFRGSELPAAVGDVTGDGRNDLVGRHQGELVVFRQTSKRRYRRLERAVGMRGYTHLTGAGDVTGDGVPDLWGHSARRDRLFLHRGEGNGQFSGRQRLSGDWSGYDALIGGADHTGDGIPDLVARRETGRLAVLPSQGDGTLGRPQGQVGRAGKLTMLTGAGDVAGNPAADLVGIDPDGQLVVKRSRGTVNLGQPVDTGRSFARGNLLRNAGDFDGDGHGDVILRRPRGPLVLFRGDGTGRLAAPVRIGGKIFRRVHDLRITQDVTGDDRPDLIGRPGTKPTVVWPGRGAERVARRHRVEVVEDRPAARASSSDDYDWDIALSDLRSRGRADLVLREAGTGYLHRLNGRRKGWGGPRYLGEAQGYDLGG